MSSVQPPDPAELAAHRIEGSMIGVKPDAAALAELVRRAASGELRTVIDRTLPHTDYRAALEYSMTGRAQGKIILTWL